MTDHHLRLSTPGSSPSPPTVDDAALIHGIVRDDPACLNLLMDRYDRLVRYTIFCLSRQKARQDPQWVDVIASETWTAFVSNVRKDTTQPLHSVRAVLSSIARNRCISALRSDARSANLEPDPLDEDDVSQIGASPDLDSPELLASRIEDLAALRKCIDLLAPDDRAVFAQIVAISERRWREAAEGLGIPESTLRSRWGRICAILRQCVAGKTGRDFAPDARPGDSFP